MTSTHLWLLRHAEVEDRYHRVFGGRLDMGLSPTGLQQAEALGRWLAHQTWDAIYASPMKRAANPRGPSPETARRAPSRSRVFAKWISGIGPG